MHSFRHATTCSLLHTLTLDVVVPWQERLGSGVEQLSERLARSGAIMRFVCRQRSQTPAPVTTPVDGCCAAGMRSHCTGCVLILTLAQARSRLLCCPALQEGCVKTSCHGRGLLSQGVSPPSCIQQMSTSSQL